MRPNNKRTLKELYILEVPLGALHWLWSQETRILVLDLTAAHWVLWQVVGIPWGSLPSFVERSIINSQPRGEDEVIQPVHSGHM